MAAVTVTRRRTNVSGVRTVKDFVVTIAADGDTLNTRLKRIESVLLSSPNENVNGSSVLVGGTVTVVDARILVGAVVSLVRILDGGAIGSYKAVVTAGQVIITSSSGTDTSTIAWAVSNPAVTRADITATSSTVTFQTTGGVSLAGVRVRVEGN